MRHYDHCAGSAEIKRMTGAKYEVMAQDVSVVESGGRTDFHYAADKTMSFPPTHVDRILHDGDTVSLGGTTLTAHLTAGHTKGTTTWTLDEIDDDRTLHVVIVGSPNVNPGYKLVHNKTYPQIASDYRHGFEVLKRLPCDIFLGAHGGYFGLAENIHAGKPATKTPSSTQPATKPTSPIVNKCLKLSSGSNRRRSTESRCLPSKASFLSRLVVSPKLLP